jgi:hypothetical protein
MGSGRPGSGRPADVTTPWSRPLGHDPLVTTPWSRPFGRALLDHGWGSGRLGAATGLLTSARAGHGAGDVLLGSLGRCLGLLGNARLCS